MANKTEVGRRGHGVLAAPYKMKYFKEKMHHKFFPGLFVYCKICSVAFFVLTLFKKADAQWHSPGIQNIQYQP
jgi:hypothetical protein